MFIEERLQTIMAALQSQGRVTVNELVDMFGVTHATIRHDLDVLEKEGLLKRTHGGAIPAKDFMVDVSYSERKDQRKDEKALIGCFAAGLILDGETIMIDSGTTTLQVAKNLGNKKDLKVFTNAVNIAVELSQYPGIKVFMTGGELNGPSLSLTGPVAEQMLRNFRVDKAILGMNAVSLSEGLTTPGIPQAEIKKLMIDSSKEIIVVCDSSKIEKTSLVYVAPLSRVSKLVTDDGIPKPIIEKYEKCGVEVLVVKRKSNLGGLGRGHAC